LATARRSVASGKLAILVDDRHEIAPGRDLTVIAPS
jgi:hypothetical protein